MQAEFCFEKINLKLRKKSVQIWKNIKDKTFYGREYSQNHIDFLIARAKEIQQKCDAFIIIGVGGSNGGSRAIIEGLHPQGEHYPQIIYAGNSLSPRQMARLLDVVKNQEVCLNVIAKNFQTIEPASHFRMLREAMEQKYGKVEASTRMVVTGSKDSLLENIANKEGYTFLEFESEIGGRFSVFSNVGLFPMAVAGIDIKALLEGRRQMLAEIQEDSHFIYDYIAYRQQAYQSGYKIEVLSAFDLDFREWLKWWVQLFGESEGKEKKGLYPSGLCFSEDLHSMGQFLQEGSPILIETFLGIKHYQKEIPFVCSRIEDDLDYLKEKTFAEMNKTMEEATIKAHKEEGIPIFNLSIDEMSEKEWGKLFIFFMVAVVISANILEVNPFNQEGVEKYKQKMFEKLRGE